MNIRRNKMQNIIILIEADGLPVCRVVAVGALFVHWMDELTF